MAFKDTLNKTKKNAEKKAKEKKYAEKPSANKPAKISDVVKVAPTKAVNGKAQTATKALPKSYKETKGSTVAKLEAQKRAGQQWERSKAAGLDSSSLTPLNLLKRDAISGTTTRDKIRYASTSGAVGRLSSSEVKAKNKKAGDKRAARDQKSAAQVLSRQDKRLPKREQTLIRDAKTSYDEARKKGDKAGMQAAHRSAENIRKSHGYSGGVTGQESISPELTHEEKVLLNKTGQERLKMAKMNLEAAKAAGNENGIAAAERAVKRILETDAFRNEGTKKLSGFVTGHGQTVDRKPLSMEEFKEGEKKFNEGLYSVMAAVPGSILSLVETSNQAIENDFLEKNRDYINDKANRLQEYKTKLELAKKGEGNPKWGSIAQLEQQVKIAERAEKMRSAGTTVDPNLPGQTLMRKSTEAQQKFMEGRTGVDRLLASAGLSMGQMIPALAASAIPGVGPAIGAGIMGAQAAGSKSYELNERGVDPAEAQLRGVTSGVIESLTEKVPISSLLKVVKAGGGANLLKSMAKQAGIEATEESISYALNHAADVAFKDPEAKFSMKDLLESAAVGAISGGTLGGIGSLAGRKVYGGQPQETAQPSRLERLGQQALMQASGLKERLSPPAETAQDAIESVPSVAQEQTQVEDATAKALATAQLEAAQEENTAPADIRETGLETRIAGIKGNDTATVGNANTAMKNTLWMHRGTQSEHGWGDTYGTAQEAFNEAVKRIDSGLFNAMENAANEAGRGINEKENLRLISTMISAAEFVRHYDVSPAAAATVISNSYRNNAMDSIRDRRGDLTGYALEQMRSIQDKIEQKAEETPRERFNRRYQDVMARIQAVTEDPSQKTPEVYAALSSELRAEYEAGLPEGMGAASSGFDPYTQAMESEAGRAYTEAIDKYGAMPQGENPSNVIEVPKSTNGRDTVSKFARNYAESESMSDEMIGRFVQDVNNGYYSYSKKSMNKLVVSVKKTIEAKGFDGALEQWEDVVQGRRMATDEDIALAQTLLSSASAAGDVDTASRLSAQIAAEATALGRAVNAFRLLKRTTPEGRLYYLRRCIDKINQDAYDNGKDYTVNLNGELAQALLGAETEEEIDAALGPIYDDIASQIPPTIADRINAWRYLAMLGNPRTHLRNIIGNVVFGQAVKARDSVSALLQASILRGEKADLRTRTFRTDKAAKEFAKADFENVKKDLGGNRYESDFTEIQKRQRKLGPAQWLADFNSDMMDRGDMWAKKNAYIRSLANYLTAKGIDTTQEIPPNILMDARAHAIEEAKYCTFQNFSELAQTLQSWEDRNAATKLLIGGIMPFKRTPINITKAAVDFSPVGLGIGIRDTFKSVRRGDVTATEGIDKIASGLTGSAIAGLGALLAWRGLLRAGDDDEDKTDILDDAAGSQEYSLVIPVGNIPGVRDVFGFQEGDTYSYTIDWAAPAAIPLFMGAEVFHAMKQRDADTTFGEAMLEGIMRMFDPIVEMTCMSGFSNAIQGAAYNRGNPMYGAFSSVAQNYAGQFVPTLLSQVAKTIDPVKRTTFYDANSKMPKLLQQIAQQNANKIPGLSQNQPAALDVWGREIKRSDNALIRALQNFVSLGELKKVESSAMEDELRRLHNLGYEGMIPSKLSKSSKINEEQISADQWSAWQKEKGQAAYNALKNFMGTEEYQALTDDQKAKFVQKVYDFAGASGKVAAGGSDDDMARWIEAAKGSEEKVGMPKEKFVSLYAYKSSLEDDLEEDEFSASIKQGVWEEYINGRSDLTDEQKSYVKDNIKFWQSKPADPSGYNKAKAAGYTDLEDIQALVDGKKEHDLDDNGNYSSAELYDYISSATDDNAEREKMWNALKSKGSNKSWYEFSKEAAPKLKAQKAAKETLDNSMSADRQKVFASAIDEYGTETQGSVARALMSVEATDAERAAYYNYIKVKREWKKSWQYVKTHKIND